MAQKITSRCIKLFVWMWHKGEWIEHSMRSRCILTIHKGKKSCLLEHLYYVGHCSDYSWSALCENHLVEKFHKCCLHTIINITKSDFITNMKVFKTAWSLTLNKCYSNIEYNWIMGWSYYQNRITLSLKDYTFHRVVSQPTSWRVPWKR